VSPDEAAQKAVDADLASVRFQVGIARGRWRKVSYEFPVLIVAVAAAEPDGTASEYFFRCELTGYPGKAPEVHIWNCEAKAVLAENKRPKGSQRLTEAFKSWGNGSVYRPWDRNGREHNNWATAHPDLAWHPKRDLAFILEDLYALLVSNATARGERPAA
jgi:hypothetical protein